MTNLGEITNLGKIISLDLINSELRRTIEDSSDIDKLRAIDKKIQYDEVLTSGQKEYYRMIVETKIDELVLEEGRNRAYA